MKGSAGERVAVILICFGYLTLFSTYAVVSGERNLEYTTGAAVQMLVLELALGGAALMLLRLRGWTRDDIGLRVTVGSTFAAVGLAVIAMLLFNIAYLGLASTGALQGWSDDAVKDSAAPAVMVLFLIVNSFYEETFVTGYIIEASRSSGTAFAVSLSAVVRLLYHTYQGPIALTMVPFSLICGLVYARYRNVWPLIVAHTLINLYSLFGS